MTSMEFSLERFRNVTLIGNSVKNVVGLSKEIYSRARKYA